MVRFIKDIQLKIVVEKSINFTKQGNGWQWGPTYNLGNLSVCVNQQPWRSFCIQPPCGQLNPVNLNVYEVLRSIYSDLLTALPAGETIHMGGDEVHMGCWNATNEIVDYMYNNGLGRSTEDFLKLWGDFHVIEMKTEN